LKNGSCLLETVIMEIFVKGAFSTVLDSLRNRNILVSLKKYFWVKSGSLCEIVWLVVKTF
jgi:hypothetical protein